MYVKPTASRFAWRNEADFRRTMARRTKKESLETRRAIIDAARDVFYCNGVTSTSLEQIAAEAGVTRGAIYWHFADKAELFYAMRDEVKIPLVDRSDLALAADERRLDPLQRIGCFLQVVIDQISKDEATRKTFQIMAFKCEYVGEFARDLDVMSAMHVELRDKLATLYRSARRSGILRPGVAPLCAASDTLIFLSGLIKIWAVDDSGTLVRKHAERLVFDHVESKRAPSPAPRRRAVSRAAPK
jgi:TetR/AcrR family transcriptional regulator, acrAB operon repressor